MFHAIAVLSATHHTNACVGSGGVGKFRPADSVEHGQAYSALLEL